MASMSQLSYEFTCFCIIKNYDSIMFKFIAVIDNPSSGVFALNDLYDSLDRTILFIYEVVCYNPSI
jgi:hypothetical protein